LQKSRILTKRLLPEKWGPLRDRAAMPKKPTPHPTLSTTRLRLRQFRVEDADAMHECFANPEAEAALEKQRIAKEWRGYA
jgi:hypothetical protein